MFPFSQEPAFAHRNSHGFQAWSTNTSVFDKEVLAGRPLNGARTVGIPTLSSARRRPNASAACGGARHAAPFGAPKHCMSRTGVRTHKNRRLWAGFWGESPAFRTRFQPAEASRQGFRPRTKAVADSGVPSEAFAQPFRPGDSTGHQTARSAASAGDRLMATAASKSSRYPLRPRRALGFASAARRRTWRER